jgi:hypothetical protein
LIRIRGESPEPQKHTPHTKNGAEKAAAPPEGSPRGTAKPDKEKFVKIQTTKILRGTAAALCAIALTMMAACGGGGGGSSAASSSTSSTGGSPSTTGSGGASSNSVGNNGVVVTVAPSVNNTLNMPEVSITLCAPGSTTNCQTIDNILVDTGSTGLRVASAAINPTLLSALPHETVGGQNLDYCQQFLDGYTWGSMRTGAVTIGPKSTASMPLQIFGDLDSTTPAPADCSDNSSSEDTPQTFYSNGVIGVSSLLQDCGSQCASYVIPATYYVCPNGACAGSTAPLAQQGQNVASVFSSDNNGVVLSLPAIPQVGQASATGTLYFGVATQSDNMMDGASILQQSALYNTLSVSYKGQTYADSFIDSGSDVYFLNDPTTSRCVGNLAAFYCPTATVSNPATFTTVSGGSVVANLVIGNAESLFDANPSFLAFNDIADSNASAGSIDFGLPFFYGRNVAVVVEGASALGSAGPFTAFTGTGS